MTGSAQTLDYGYMETHCPALDTWYICQKAEAWIGVGSFVLPYFCFWTGREISRLDKMGYSMCLHVHLGVESIKRQYTIIQYVQIPPESYFFV